MSTPLTSDLRAIQEAENARFGDMATCIYSKAADRIEDLERERERDELAVGIVKATEIIAELRAELADSRANETSALQLVSFIREALGDNGRRMQSELIAHCWEVAADAERLDWLQHHDMPALIFYARDLGTWILDGQDNDIEASVREAIDAARKAAP